MALASPALTIGEVTRASGITRPFHWLLVVFYPCLCMGVSAVCSYGLLADPIYTVGSPWRVPVFMLLGVYMALIGVIKMFMHMFLPGAPLAVAKAFVNVGWLWVGLPVGLVALFSVYFGPEWMLIAVAALYAVLMASVLAFWLWLVRAYRKQCD
uniref:DUF7378 domain-containing protein n=1 Tax=Arundo donax TaxID=35708 RepID=A0A0A8Z218_ARUDO